MTIKYFAAILMLTACTSFKEAGDMNKAKGNLTLNPQKPQKGAAIQIGYQPTEGKMAGADSVQAILFYNTGNGFDLGFGVDIPLSGNKKSGWKASYKLPDSAVAFTLMFTSGNLKDDNGEKGYLFLVYKGEEPVKAAYAGAAMIYSFSSFLMGVSENLSDTAVKLFEKEFTRNPDLKNEMSYFYYNAMLPGKGKEVVYPESEKLAAAIIANPAATENDFRVATMLYDLQQGAADEKKQVALDKGYAKYPLGEFGFNNYIKSKFHQEYAKKPAGRDSAIAFHQKFLEKHAAADPESLAGQMNLEMVNQIAIGYTNAGEYTKAMDYLEYMKNDKNFEFQKAWMSNFIAGKMLEKKQDLQIAERYSEVAMKGIDELLSNYEKTYKPSSVSYSQSKDMAVKRGYCWFADNYAQILDLNGKSAKALEVEKTVCDIFKWENPEYNERYVGYLAKTGNIKEVGTVAQNLIRSGFASTKIKQLYKESYIKEKGSESGFDQYITSLESKAKEELHKKTYEEVMKQKVNVAAKNFSLQDLQGNTVSLASLKGKVVVLDFWATWCAPCKASFPAMKLAVKKYSTDTNVVFLFINTMESAEKTKRITSITDYLKANDYPFHVVLDMPSEKNKSVHVVADDYSVEGIPTKIVIDAKGQMRFKSSSYETEDKLLEELAIMISAAKK